MGRLATTRRYSDATWAEALAHRGLVETLARWYRGRGLDREDLLQVGLIGACEAVVRYRPEIGKFSTYARYWIQQAIRLELARFGSVVRVPYGAFTRRNKALRGEPLDPGDARIARDATVALSGRSGLFDEHEAPADRIDARELADVRAALAHLTGDERCILDGRADGLTYRALGTRLGYSREWVRQIERRALERVRDVLRIDR